MLVSGLEFTKRLMIKANREDPDQTASYENQKITIAPSDLFDLILYVPSTIFQLNRDGSSWVEPVLS